MGKRFSRKTNAMFKVAALAMLVGGMGSAEAFRVDSSSDWDIRFDNSVQYTMGWRMQERNAAIANHFAYQAGDAKFDKGDMVTNRIQDLIEAQAVYQGTMGVRVSASIWKDFAYNDNAKINSIYAGSFGNPYTGGKYNDYAQGDGAARL